MSVYLAAHQDDCQLFMEPLLSADLLDASRKTVIIHITAGDAGVADAYWQARESAAVQSLVFRLSEFGAVQPHTTTVTVGNRPHRRDELPNVVVYFLRLPDGNKDGSGFARQHYASLAQLQRAGIYSLRAVDQSAQYASCADVAAQIQALIDRERLVDEQCIPDKFIELNFPEYDETISPGDHSDHYVTGCLGLLLMSESQVSRRLFTHYATRHRQDYLAGDALFWKTGMFAVYNQVVLQESGHSTLGEKSHYQRWCAANAFYRELQSSWPIS